MSDVMDKGRRLRLERLQKMIDERLENPAAALDVLMREMQAGEPKPESWEGIHGAAARDGKEAELASAYQRLTIPRQLKKLPAEFGAELLMHAADFHLGVMGDRDAARDTLVRVLELVPDHPEAFRRLEVRYEGDGDKQRLGELYAGMIAAQLDPSAELARKTMNLVSALPAKKPLSDDACRNLLSLVKDNTIVLDTLEAHCRKTDRHSLACELLEKAIGAHTLPEATEIEQRRRLIAMYTGEAKEPEKAIDHVELLLERDPNDAKARAGAEALLKSRDVSSRAAAALQAARRASMKPNV